MEVKVITDVLDEPISLTTIKDFCRIDRDYTSNDDILNIIAVSAREKLEKFTNLSFAPKTLLVQFNSLCFELPYGPIIEILEVAPLSSPSEPITDYTVTGLDFKKIHLEGSSSIEFFYPISGGLPEIWKYNGGICSTFNAEYEAGYQVLPAELKHALLLQIDWDFKNQGREDIGLCPVALEKARPFSRNLVIS